MKSIFHRSAAFVEKHKRHHHLALATLALIVAGGGYTYWHELAHAATNTFNQSITSLGGGGWATLSTTATSTGLSNKLNWSKFTATSTGVTADGSTGVSLGANSRTIVDDGEVSTFASLGAGTNPYALTISC